MALLCLVNAIPEEDLSIIRQLELLSNKTYNLIVQNKIEFYTYAAKLVVDCKAVNATELKRWQHWLDLSDAEKIIMTEKAIAKFVDSMKSLQKIPYDNYIPDDELEFSLNTLTNYAYWRTLNDYQYRNREILESFRNETGPKIKEVTNTTRQSNKVFFKFFDIFLERGQENLFMYLQSKAIRYEDRVLFFEVFHLAQKIIQPFDRKYMYYIKNQVEAMISCEVVNQTDMSNLKYLHGLIKEKIKTLVDFEFLIIFNAISSNLPQFDHRENGEEFVKCLANATPRYLNKLIAKIGLEFLNRLDNFIKEAEPKLCQVSNITKQLNKRIFDDFADLSNPDNRWNGLRSLIKGISFVIP
ncbi:uncharacterized protein LOC117791578 [Drosophila innubila]|uniref:uncharacterized protein LOC117791578 n=1 Tax=Drosophila innubila TaxID=198719 RepID=UPI00148CC11E|nr:uncharacterized protein LOC117791578 [Drosophila innubila]